MLKPIAIVGVSLFVVGVIGFVAVALSGAGFPTGGVSVFDWNSGNPATHVIDQTKTFTGTGLSGIQVNADAAAIHLSRATGNQVQVHLYGQERVVSGGQDIVFDAAVQNHELQVEVRHPQTIASFGFGAANLGLTLDVALPETLYQQVFITTNAGAIEAVGLRAHQFDLESNAGTTTANGLTGDLTARTNAGAIHVQNVAGVLRLSTNAGAIVIEQHELKQNIDAESNAGAIKITTDSEPAGLQFDLETKVGRASLGLPNAKLERQAVNGLIGSIGTGGPLIHAHTDVGAISLNRN